MMFRKETEIQETEIGKIPKDWKIEKLSSLATIIMGQSPPSSTYNKEGKGLPFIQGKIEFGKMYPSPTTYTSRPLKIAEKGDVLMSVRAPVGDVNIAPYKLCIGRGLAAIRFNPKMANNLFYFYYLQSIKNRLESLGKGSTFKAITKKDLEELRIVYPPLNEQKGIADVLLMVDRGIEIVDRAVAKLEGMKRALLNELLTGRIRVREENGKLTFYKETEFQETEIGEMPKDWKIEKLKNIVIKAKMGGTPRSTVREYWGGDIPFAKVEDITSSHKYLFKTSTTITKLGLENSNAWIIPKDSLLITIYGTLGAVAINKIELATNQAIVGIIPRKDIVDVEYLYYWYSFFQPNWNKYVKKSTQPNLTLEIVTNSKLPLPSIKEQKRIADVLSTIDSSIELYYREKEKLLRLRKGLIGVLLTGRVRVVSDVRDVGVVA